MDYCVWKYENPRIRERFLFRDIYNYDQGAIIPRDEYIYIIERVEKPIKNIFFLSPQIQDVLEFLFLSKISWKSLGLYKIVDKGNQPSMLAYIKNFPSSGIIKIQSALVRPLELDRQDNLSRYIDALSKILILEFKNEIISFKDYLIAIKSNSTLEAQILVAWPPLESLSKKIIGSKGNIVSSTISSQIKSGVKKIIEAGVQEESESKSIQEEFEKRYSMFFSYPAKKIVEECFKLLPSDLRWCGDNRLVYLVYEARNLIMHEGANIDAIIKNKRIRERGINSPQDLIDDLEYYSDLLIRFLIGIAQLELKIDTRFGEREPAYSLSHPLKLLAWNKPKIEEVMLNHDYTNDFYKLDTKDIQFEVKVGNETREGPVDIWGGVYRFKFQYDHELPDLSEIQCPSHGSKKCYLNNGFYQVDSIDSGLTDPYQHSISFSRFLVTLSDRVELRFE
nr:hypothetical protein [Candidatus Sigynarchaeota archaeon]